MRASTRDTLQHKFTPVLLVAKLHNQVCCSLVRVALLGLMYII